MQGVMDLKVPHVLLMTAPPINDEGRKQFIGRLGWQEWQEWRGGAPPAFTSHPRISF